jgi:polyhydroxyalkanoate synthesis regulator protein
MKVKKTINLKKYNNRKLYAPVGELNDYGHYVSIKDVIAEIKKGNEVVIKKGAEDVTNAVLKEAIKELDLSTEVMAQLIRG